MLARLQYSVSVYMHWETSNFSGLTLLQYLLYCGGWKGTHVIPRGMPTGVFSFYSNVLITPHQSSPEYVEYLSIHKTPGLIG